MAQCASGFRGSTRSHRLMTGRARILLAGIDGQGHLGDEAAVEALVTGLRQRLPDLRLTVVAADEERVRTWLEVPTVSCTEWAALAAAIDGADCVVLSGGRELSDSDGFAPEQMLEDGVRGLAHTVGMAVLAVTQQRPLVLASAAIGRLQPPQARTAVGTLAHHAVHIVAADESSRSRLVELGVDAAHVEVGTDPVLALRPGTAARVDEILEAMGLACHASGLVAVVLSSSPAEGAYQPMLAAALTDLVRKTSATVVLVPFQTEVPAQVVEHLRGRLPANRVHALVAGLRPRDIAALLGRCELVVALPRHGAVLAAVGGAPALWLSSSTDAAQATGDLGLAGLAFVPDAPTDLSERLTWAWERRTELRRSLGPATAELASRATRSLDRLASTLAGLPALPESLSLAPLLAPALHGLIKRARVVGFAHQRLCREAEARAAAQHRDLVGQIEDRDRLVRGLQAELHAKVGERDRVIRDLQLELSTKVEERDRVIRELQASLAKKESGS